MNGSFYFPARGEIENALRSGFLSLDEEMLKGLLTKSFKQSKQVPWGVRLAHVRS